MNTFIMAFPTVIVIIDVYIRYLSQTYLSHAIHYCFSVAYLISYNRYKILLISKFFV